MIDRNEYPRPQFVRNEWVCLNGKWEFEIDQGDSGLERGLLKRKLKDHINIPFCPESKLSGICNKDYLNSVWYRRELTIPSDWKGKRILLHFQAVDYDATVWIDEVEVGRHRGGFSPFSIDITESIHPGESKQLVVRARDRDDLPQPRGGAAAGGRARPYPALAACRRAAARGRAAGARAGAQRGALRTRQ